MSKHLHRQLKTNVFQCVCSKNSKNQIYRVCINKIASVNNFAPIGSTMSCIKHDACVSNEVHCWVTSRIHMFINNETNVKRQWLQKVKLQKGQLDWGLIKRLGVIRPKASVSLVLHMLFCFYLFSVNETRSMHGIFIIKIMLNNVEVTFKESKELIYTSVFMFGIFFFNFMFNILHETLLS